jgi:hypothetical protein
MRVRIWPSRKLVRDRIARRRVTLIDDGYYWWLYPYFEASKLPPRTGEVLPLYQGSEICGQEVVALHEQLLKAKIDAAASPEAWTVHVGWADESRRTERHERVNRDSMLAPIDKLISLTARAAQENLSVLCEDP